MPRIVTLQRRSYLLLLLLAPTSADANSPSGEVLVVSSSDAAAYVEAVEGLKSALLAADKAPTVVTLGAGDRGTGLQPGMVRKAAIVVAVGSAAEEAVIAAGVDVPIVATMVLTPRQTEGRVATTISLEIPPSSILKQLAQLYPGRKRIAVLRGPALSASSTEEILAAGRKYGYELQTIDSPGPRQLLDSLPSFRGRFDFVWCFPDTALYQGPTVGALVLATIRMGLPLIGFSEGFVRAGALVGFYPDYRDVGLQTGDSVLRHLNGQASPPRQAPRKSKGAMNERVRRVLGLEYTQGAAEGFVVAK